MSDEPRRGRPDDEDIDARFAEIVAGLTLSGDRQPREPGGRRQPEGRDSEGWDAGERDSGERDSGEGASVKRDSVARDPDDPQPDPEPRGRGGVAGAELGGPAGPGDETTAPRPEPGGRPEADPAAQDAPSTWREWTDPDVEEHFVPPDPPPLPAGDLHFWGILVGLLGGPLILFLAHGLQVLHGSVWSWLGLGLALGGFALLVLRLPTHREDDPTGGARV